MAGKRKLIFNKAISISFWFLFGIASMMLLIAAINKKAHSKCTGVNLIFSNNDNNYFIKQQDIVSIIENTIGGNAVGKTLNEFDLYAIENKIMQEPGVYKAEIFFDNNGRLNVLINVSKPIARVFTTNGNTFYVDSMLNKLPAYKNNPIQLPVFVNVPVYSEKLTLTDSILLRDINVMSLSIQRDTFLTAITDQIYINENREFELMPKIGNQIIQLGNINDLEKKFYKLKFFYKKIMPLYGVDKYGLISLQFKNQIVAKVNGLEDFKADSIKALNFMNTLAAYSSKMSVDTSKVLPESSNSVSESASFIEKSYDREVINEANNQNSASEKQKVTNNLKEKNPIKKTPNLNTKKAEKKIKAKNVIKETSVNSKANKDKNTLSEIPPKNDY